MSHIKYLVTLGRYCSHQQSSYSTVRVISTILNDTFGDGLSLHLLGFKVMTLMTRKAQDVSSASGTRDGMCSDQDRSLVEDLVPSAAFRIPDMTQSDFSLKVS